MLEHIYASYYSRGMFTGDIGMFDCRCNADEEW